ncbi:FHA domain-containing protein [Cellulomonas sp. URHB0016]
MSPVRCPQGHTSDSTDYCDVCGTPIVAAAAAPAPPAAAEPSTCAHCGFPAAAGALFCENCGYDFTTGSLPVASTPVASTSGAPSTVPSALGLSAPDPTPAPAPTPALVSTSAPDPSGQTPNALAPTGLDTPPPAGPDEWVAEIWVDPDWYAVQKPEDPIPSPGPPALVPLRERSVLVGRPSVSRNIHPKVDCGADSGVSRRQCQLNTDGQRWWVEDLDSSNGTYVSRVGDPIPTQPIPSGQRRELQDGDRLYVGAWTRIVIRKALPGEV